MRNETLTELFNEAVGWGTPLGVIDSSVKNSVFSDTRKVYLEVNNTVYGVDNSLDYSLTRRFGSRYLLPPNYVAAVDLFEPQMADLIVFGEDGFDFVTLPVGHASAFYHGDTESLAIDTIAIPGTSKNRWAQSLYRVALHTVDRLIKRYPRLQNGLRNLRHFYEDILNTLASRKEMKKTIVHEMYHHLLEKEGLSTYLTPPVNEALAVNLTDEQIGEESSLEGTTYHDLKTKVRTAFSRFVNSAKSFLKKYREKGTSLIDSLYRQPEVKELAKA